MTLTNAYKRSAFDPDTADVWLVLITIAHASISPSIRVVNNMEDVVSNGDTFVGFPFDVMLPDDTDDAPPAAKLTIDNVSREIGEAIRAITSAPTVSIQIVRAAAPNTVEQSWSGFSLRNVKWDAGKVAGDLVLENFTDEPYPAGNFSPASFPALYVT